MEVRPVGSPWESVVRATPVVRFGGDEFVGLLDLSLHDAVNRFSTIKHELDDDDVSFSVGLAALDGDDTLEQLLAQADAAMYAERSRRVPAEDRRTSG